MCKLPKYFIYTKDGTPLRFWLPLPLLFMYNAGKLVLFIVICQMAVQ